MSWWHWEHDRLGLLETPLGILHLCRQSLREEDGPPRWIGAGFVKPGVDSDQIQFVKEFDARVGGLEPEGLMHKLKGGGNRRLFFIMATWLVPMAA